MKAIQMTAYGDSSVLKMGEAEIPVAKADEVLIKISATTVNPLDMKIRSGAMQQFMPVPLPFIPGIDVAGVVDAVGENVSRFKVGDAVFATTFGGTYAQYTAIRESIISPMPNNVTMNEAAALAVPITTAYTALVEAGNLQLGQKVLIHGAAGAVGAATLQMAKAMGAYVIGTASGKGLELIELLGADEVIDYKSQDFSGLVANVDLVIDLVGGETQIKSYPIIKKGGKLISTVMPTSDALAEKFAITAQFIDATPGYEKLAFGKRLVEEGKIKTQIAMTMSLEDAAQAQDLVSAGGLNGKLVLQIV